MSCNGPICYRAVATGNLAILQKVFKEANLVEQGEAHTFHHFTLIGSGSVLVEWEGVKGPQSEVFQAGAMIWIPKGRRHRMTSKEAWTVAYCIHAMHKKDDVGDVLEDADVPGTPRTFSDCFPISENMARLQNLL